MGVTEDLQPGDFVLFPWAENFGQAWVHPDDLAVTRELQPYGKVLRFDGQADGWAVVRYGNASIRATPSRLKKIPSPRFWLGDRVVESSRGAGRVTKVMWHHDRAEAFFHVDFDQKKSSMRFFGADLEPLGS